MRKALFVSYGSGHAAALLPVARRMKAQRVLEPVYLALTTAQSTVRAAGISTLGFADFVEPGDALALDRGVQLSRELGSLQVSANESAAYMGLSYRDLEQRFGIQQAAERYRLFGRQAFEPVQTLKRIIGKVQPEVVVCTSSPRAERAAILAAGELGVPSVCVVDLFGVDEVAWVGRPGYAKAVAVMSRSVKDRMVAAGRQEQEVFVTGNPAFDDLHDPSVLSRGQLLRREMQWSSRKVVLWASQVEPRSHPNLPGRRGDPELPRRISLELNRWARDTSDRTVVYRMHPSEQVPLLPGDALWIVDRGRFELTPLLAAADIVVSMNSTVALQAGLMGKPVVQVLGSIADDSLALWREGLAVACKDPQDLGRVIERTLTKQMPREPSTVTGAITATEEVLRVIYQLVERSGIAPRDC